MKSNEQASIPGVDSGHANILRTCLVAGLGTTVDVSSFRPDTLLLGHIEALDSLAVVNILMAMEEHFDIEIHDDEVDATLFQSFGSLLSFLQGKLTQQDSDAAPMG